MTPEKQYLEQNKISKNKIIKRIVYYLFKRWNYTLECYRFFDGKIKNPVDRFEGIDYININKRE